MFHVGGPGWRSRPVKPETTDCCIVWSCDGAYIKLQQRAFKVHSNSTGPPIRLCRRSFWQVVTRQNLPFWLQWLQKQHMSRERDIQEEQPEKKWRIRCCSLLLCLLTFLLFGGKDTESMLYRLVKVQTCTTKTSADRPWVLFCIQASKIHIIQLQIKGNRWNHYDESAVRPKIKQ